MSNIGSNVPDTMVRSRSGPRLVVQQGVERGKIFAIPPTGLVAGRSAECTLLLDDVEVSRRHARFYWHGAHLMLEDLGSANGTLVNGRAISGAQPLNERDMVGIGGSVFIVQGLVSQELTPTARNLDAVAPMVSPPYAAPSRPQASQSSGTFWLVVIGLGLAALVVILGVGALWYLSQTPPPVSQAPAVTILTPANGTQVASNVPLIVQASATDSRGVTRLELWADGVLVSQQASPSPQGASPLLLNLLWPPTTPGSHVLEVRAFNAANQQSIPALVTVNVIGETATPTSEAAPPETPTSAPTAAPTATGPAIILFTPTPSPTPTSEAKPALQAVADVNVRSGPGTGYPILGLMRAGDTVVAAGRSADGAWWQIIFPPNSGALGWVVGTYIQPNDAAGTVPVVAGPPPPPTNTPQPAPPTNTPQPAAETTFTADNTQLYQGQCTKLRWQVKNVAAYFVDGIAGAGDQGDRDVCDPVGTKTHTLRVQKLDGSTQDFTVTITVQASNVPKPEQKSPEDEDDFGEGDDVRFDWSDVSAPGTVTYNIEIQYEDDDDWKNWHTINGLTSSTYTMEDFPNDRLGRWRVWATSSSAGNSEMSGWREFSFED